MWTKVRQWKRLESWSPFGEFAGKSAGFVVCFLCRAIDYIRLATSLLFERPICVDSRSLELLRNCSWKPLGPKNLRTALSVRVVICFHALAGRSAGLTWEVIRWIGFRASVDYVSAGQTLCTVADECWLSAESIFQVIPSPLLHLVIGPIPRALNHNNFQLPTGFVLMVG